MEEHHDFEEGEEHDDSNGVGDSRQDGTEFLATHAEKRTHATSHGKQARENTGIDSDGTKGYKCYTDQRISCHQTVSGD